MPLPDSIRDRIELFARNEDQYRDSGYKEAQLRQEFLDPLFAALGWDMENKAGHAESYKDVVHEDAIKIGSESKAPDYSFRIGGTRKFFVEAKKPSVLIKDDPAPAYQLRRYSWSAKLPLGILTDFQEFAIYDTRVRPAFGDKAHVARLFYCTYRDFPAKWDEIADIFSKDSVLRGSFDKYAATTRGKRGTATVDVAFLEEIERWRDVFARHLALRNDSLAQRDLNFAVQRLIDRLIFLRIAEDRGLEPFGQLQALTGMPSEAPAKEGGHPKIYPRLREIFERADYRYNSGLFHFEKDSDCTESPDRLSLRLELDDAPLKDVLKNLYYPASPYVFSVIPADILGSVYERFLGKVIHLTDGHRARIEEKPEVRKAGGVYYTPTYIVDYIVRQTVGTLVAGKTPKQIEKLRVLDPACGSGSFLIGAYQFLLDWYLDYYVRNDPEKWAKQKPARLYETNPNAGRDAFGQLRTPPGSIRTPQSEIRIPRNWQLTTAERKRILLAHIHGVDIDAQAVEVTKLSLLLKVLEGEARETQGRTREMSAVLPDLGKNIRCGNSLVGHDFYAQPDLPALDDEARLQLNTFDWAEGFPEVMRAGGFDAVIGNPPYVRQESIKEQKAYFETHFASFDGTADLFIYFIEQGLKLLRSGGRYSIIVSSSLLRAAYAEPLRRHVLASAAVEQIVDFGGLAVFADAKDTYVCIPVLSKTSQPAKVQACRIRSLEFENLGAVAAREAYAIPASRLTTESFSIKSDAEAAVFDKIVRAGTPLGQILGSDQFFRGVVTGLNEAFVIDSKTRYELLAADPKCAEVIKPWTTGENVREWRICGEPVWLLFIRRGTDIDRYPAVKKHLMKYQAELTPKRTSADKKGRKPGHYRWYEIQDDVAYYEIFEQPKIVFPDICKFPRFVLDKTGTYIANTAYCLGSGDRYLVAILNSRLCWFAISNIAIPFGMRAGEFRYRLFYQYMEKVPIRQIDPKSKSDRATHDRLVALVDTMLALHAKLGAAQSPDVEDNLRRQIAATDRAIDALVYALYGLTPAEIALVESATAPQAAAMNSETEQPNRS